MTNKTNTLLVAIVILETCFIVAIPLSIILSKAAKNKEPLPTESQYNSHDYIYFHNKGVVHSPDCKHCKLIFD